MDDNGTTMMGRYLRRVEDRLRASWTSDGDIAGKWTIFKSALCEGAELELGYVNKRQPDWYSW